MYNCTLERCHPADLIVLTLVQKLFDMYLDVEFEDFVALKISLPSPSGTLVEKHESNWV